MSKWILLVALMLAGCATPADRAAQWQAEVDQMMQTYGPACDRLGFSRSDDKWRECVLKLANRDERRYASYPRQTTCFGHMGFYDCTTF